MTKKDRIDLMNLIPKKRSIDQRKDNCNDSNMTNGNGKNGKVTNGNGKSGNNTSYGMAMVMVVMVMVLKAMVSVAKRIITMITIKRRRRKEKV